MWQVGEGEWAKGKEDDLGALGSTVRADAGTVNHFRLIILPLIGLSRT